MRVLRREVYARNGTDTETHGHKDEPLGGDHRTGRVQRRITLPPCNKRFIQSSNAMARRLGAARSSFEPPVRSCPKVPAQQRLRVVTSSITLGATLLAAVTVDTCPDRACDGTSTAALERRIRPRLQQEADGARVALHTILWLLRGLDRPTTRTVKAHCRPQLRPAQLRQAVHVRRYEVAIDELLVAHTKTRLWTGEWAGKETSGRGMCEGRARDQGRVPTM